MKKLFIKNKYAQVVFAIALLVFIGSTSAKANLIPNPHSMPYTVTATPVPVVTISTSPTSGTVNVVHGNVIWSATNSPTSCNATGDWATTGAKPTSMASPGQDQGVLTQVRTYTYTLTCSNAGGASAPASATVVVNAAVNQPPVVNAGPNQNLTQPQSSTSVTGTASDPDGTISSTTWTQVGSTPSAANIVSPSSLSTTITGLTTIGIYTFRLSATDNSNATTTADMTITVGATPPSGNITTNVATCTVPINTNACTGVTATWTSSNTTSPNVWNGTSQISTLANNTNFPVTVTYPSTTFTLRDGVTSLSSATVVANCGANTWNGSACVAPVVNGICAAGHFNCSSGTYPGGGTGGVSGPWAWQCVGSGGGTTASCNESVLPQCSDGADNDGDGLVDKNDPGCHVGNVLSGAYDPNDNTENNNPKIKEVEQ